MKNPRKEIQALLARIDDLTLALPEKDYIYLLNRLVDRINYPTHIERLNPIVRKRLERAIEDARHTGQKQ